MSEMDPRPQEVPVTPDAAAVVEAAQEQSSEKPAETPKPQKPRRPLKQVLRLVGVRAYTFALLAGVALICGVSLLYLFRSVFTPAQLPESLGQWQGSLEATALRQPNVPGVTDGAGRAPISHYHKVDRWFQADRHNGCTVAGCHEPLPHTVKSKVAAFANLHVTFMDCMVCHEPHGTARVDAQWVSLESNRPQESPAALRLIRLLEANGIAKESAAELHPQIQGLLKETLATVGHNELIADLLVQIETSVPGSPVWMKSVKRLTAEIPLHARGEYGAKLVRQKQALDQRRMAEQTRAYLAQASETSRKELESTIHEKVLLKPDACGACHTQESGGGMLDLEGLGYSPQRAASLRALPLAGLMQQIRQGETFQLPKLIEADDGR